MKIFQPLAFAFLLTVSFAMAEEKTVYLDEMDLSKTTCGWKLTGCGGGGYLVLVSDAPVANAIKVVPCGSNN